MPTGLPQLASANQRRFRFVRVCPDCTVPAPGPHSADCAGQWPVSAGGTRRRVVEGTFRVPLERLPAGVRVA